MKTLLAPVDFSPVSASVIAEAVALARSVNARVVILNVVQPPSVSDAAMSGQMSADFAAESPEAAEKKLCALQRELVTKGVTVETRHVVGFPGQRIVDFASTLAADYIVLGSHGHGAFYDLIVGSTTSRVLKDANCPVVVVPRGKRKNRK